MSEIELHQPQSDLIGQMEYAKAVSVGSMLPDQYRNNPANVLIAVGLGQSMGLSPAESLYRIAVIKGKPTASAELIAANVRKAGHRLRITGDETSATATIIRADDPDFEFTATRDMAWAKAMKLDGNDNYRKQPGTMLRWRAITAVAREACPEALYGVAYTADEMFDGVQRTAPASAGLASVHVEQVTPDTSPAPDVGASEAVDDAAPLQEAQDVQPSAGEAPLDTRSSLARRMFATMRDAGIDDKEDRLAVCSEVAGRTIASSAELTEAEAEAVIREVAG